MTAVAATATPRRRRPFTIGKLPLLDSAYLRTAFAEAGMKPLHADRVLRRVLRAPLIADVRAGKGGVGTCQKSALQSALESLPGLPTAARDLVRDQFVVLTSKVVHAQTSADGTATKLLVELHDGLQVETVIIKVPRPDGLLPRTMLCVSSQVGCRMGCKFCSTGRMGELGDLAAGEILEQLCHARRWAKPSNVMFMGMGEPLNNFEAVASAARAMVDRGQFGLRRKAVNVSTVGVIPRMRELRSVLPGVSMSLSLHAPNQKLRESLLPSARQYPLDELMRAVDDVTGVGALSGERCSPRSRRGANVVQVEYVLLDGINDSDGHAHELGALLHGRSVYVNLIPYNSSNSRLAYRAPTAEKVQRMRSILIDHFGLQVSVRTERGSDIAGACGQLVVPKGRAVASGGLHIDEPMGCARSDEDDVRLLLPDFYRSLWS